MLKTSFNMLHPGLGKLFGAAVLAFVLIWALGIRSGSAAPVPSEAPANIGLAKSAPVGDSVLTPYEREGFAAIRQALRLDLGQVHAASGADRVWLAYGSGKVCVLVDDGRGIAAGCATREITEQGRLAFETRSTTGDARRIVGVVPDDVTVVMAVDSSGGVVDKSAVVENVYRISGTGIDHLVLVGVDGATRAIPVS